MVRVVALLGRHVLILGFADFRRERRLVVQEVAPAAVVAETGGVERPAQLRLVLGVPQRVPQLLLAVRELALAAVLARARRGELAAQLGLVLARRHHAGRRRLLQVLQSGHGQVVGQELLVDRRLEVRGQRERVYEHVAERVGSLAAGTFAQSLRRSAHVEQSHQGDF